MFGKHLSDNRQLESIKTRVYKSFATRCPREAPVFSHPPTLFCPLSRLQREIGSYSALSYVGPAKSPKTFSLQAVLPSLLAELADADGGCLIFCL